jgi:DHA2 family multidrug resistance protein
MAQASGLINVIRQIGGSIGVALFGTILTRRTIYHAEVYGSQLNSYSESYTNTMHRLSHFIIESAGGTVRDAAVKGESIIGMFVQKQAFVQAVDDVFLLAAFVLLISMVPVFFLRTKGRKKGGSVAVTE